MKIETKNARITSTVLGIEDDGILTASMFLDYGGTSQGFDLYSSGSSGSAFGMAAIHKVLEVVGVHKWEDLPGTHIRVVSDVGKVYRVGHITEDKWFDPHALAVMLALNT